MSDARARIVSLLRRYTATALLTSLVAVVLSGCLLVPVPVPAGDGHHGRNHHGHRHRW